MEARMTAIQASLASNYKGGTGYQKWRRLRADCEWLLALVQEARQHQQCQCSCYHREPSQQVQCTWLDYTVAP